MWLHSDTFHVSLDKIRLIKKMFLASEIFRLTERTWTLFSWVERETSITCFKGLLINPGYLFLNLQLWNKTLQVCIVSISYICRAPNHKLTIVATPVADYQGQGNFFLTLYTQCDFHHNSYLIIWPLTPQVPVQLPGRGGQLPPQAPVPVWLSGLPCRGGVAGVLLSPAAALGTLPPCQTGPLWPQVTCLAWLCIITVQLLTCSMGSKVEYVVCLMSECSLLYL